MGLSTFGAYVQYLIKVKISPYFKEADEVHVLFDHPEIWDINLKSNVQKKRDAGKKQIPPLQGPISDDTEVPTPKMWPSFLANRQDKRKLQE